jgi:hypothetical protein
MNDSHANQLVQRVEHIEMILNRIAAALEKLAAASVQPPNRG